MSGMVGNLFGSKGNRAESTQSSASGLAALPQYAQDAYKGAIGQAQTLASDNSLFTPVALNQYQTGAGNLIQQGYTPIDQNSLGSMMSLFNNPYEDQVVSKAIGDLRTTGQGLLSDLGAGATAAGGFGGTRQATLESELIKNLSQQAADTSSQIRSDNYNSAVGNALGSIGTNNQLQSQQISDLSNYGALVQNQETATKQAPLESLSFLLKALGALPQTGTSSGTSLGAQEDAGFMGRLGQIAANFGQLVPK